MRRFHLCPAPWADGDSAISEALRLSFLSAAGWADTPTVLLLGENSQREGTRHV